MTTTDPLLQHLRIEQNTALAEARTLAAGPATGADAVKLEAALMDAERANERIQRFAAASVVSEPLVYEPATPASYFRDLYRSKYLADTEASGRLSRHRAQMAVEMPRIARMRNEELLRRGAQVGGVTVEQRALGNTGAAAGAGGEFAPPLWLTERWASVPRAAAPLATACTTLPLPDGASTVSVPLFSANTGAALQTTQNTAIADIGGSTTSSVSSGISLFGARAVVSEQLFDQTSPGAGHIDQVVFDDLASSAYEQLEVQLINGTGTGSQLRGLLNVAGITSSTYTDLTPTGGEFLTGLAQTASLTSTARKRLVTMILMHPRRFFWLASQADASGRPLIEPGDGPLMGIGDAGPVGPFYGAVPGYLTTAVPTNLGAGTNQDPAIVTRPADHLLLVSTPETMVATETYADSVGVLLRLTFTAAFLGSRYPSATGVLNGTGMIAPAGF
jgi:HK97 family phage major capsid protein